MDIHFIDLSIFVIYLIAMLSVGVYFFKDNKSEEDYFVGGRGMAAGHIGLSVVATDVGGGFSIGLGGLGFVMGISGSWMLFTGLLGAWLSAVILIPRVHPQGKAGNFLTFPDTLSFHYGKQVAFVAAIISMIGYIGFSSSQILAGAKLAAATFPVISINNAALIMGVIAVVYTVIGGIKAVIYTDTVQWAILMIGLIFVGIPIGYYQVGGWEAIKTHVPAGFLSLSNITFIQFFNWLITIVPIWFIGMTLYQRIFACKDVRTARKAWYIAGLFEWPVMAMMGVTLGLFSRVAYEQGMFSELGFPAGQDMDAELGLPMLLSNILPVGVMGLMMSAYFSAIMSTADSCLMAASGNLTSDVIGFFRQGKKSIPIKVSQMLTLTIGVIAIILATMMQSVLDLMLYSYAFMVSGLFVPLVATLILKKPSAYAALVAMVAGGSTTLTLIFLKTELPYGLDANFFGIILSAISFTAVQLIKSKSYS